MNSSTRPNSTFTNLFANTSATYDIQRASTYEKGQICIVQVGAAVGPFHPSSLYEDSSAFFTCFYMFTGHETESMQTKPFATAVTMSLLCHFPLTDLEDVNVGGCRNVVQAWWWFSSFCFGIMAKQSFSLKNATFKLFEYVC